MLIGAHVSTAGGLTTAVRRGSDMECEAIQIVNQSPRVWKPNEYGEEDFAAFEEARREAGIDAVAIHTSYLINCATRDSSLREKSLASLVHALRLGDAIGSVGVVLHAGSQKGDALAPSLERAGELLVEALEETGSCSLLIEHTAGGGGQLGRSFGQIAELFDRAGGSTRLGLCLDTCHLYAQGYDVTRRAALNALLDEVDEKLGPGRLRCLHLNDSRDPLGSRRDRHANLGRGAMGPRGLAAVLTEPRLEGLPGLLETPGPDRKGPDAGEVVKARMLRREARAGAAPLRPDRVAAGRF